MPTTNPFSEKELSLLQAFAANEVRYLMVGLSAAALQGAPVVTQDVDLWLEDLRDEKFQAALESVGAMYVSGFGQAPPTIAGEGFALFDLVLNMSGLPDFAAEYENALIMDIEGIVIPVLPLERILHSKKTANRDKDKLVLKVLEDALHTVKIKKGK